jgi:lipoyl(octanoyl) transferase
VKGDYGAGEKDRVGVGVGGRAPSVPTPTPTPTRPSAPSRRLITSSAEEAWLVHLGLIPYDEALDLQLAAVHARAEDRIPDTLLLLEHPAVITLGRGADPANVLASPEELARREIALRETGRGGDVTLHAPGQLVGYPIVDLRARGRDVHRYLRDLEELLIQALAGWGIPAGRVPGLTGVWAGNDKVAAIGVGVKRWTTYHGFALNVSVDLTLFETIVPCGLTGRGVTSVARLLGLNETRKPKPDTELTRRHGGRWGVTGRSDGSDGNDGVRLSDHPITPSPHHPITPSASVASVSPCLRVDSDPPYSLQQTLCIEEAAERVAAAWPTVFPSRLIEIPRQRWESAIRGANSSAITTSRNTRTSVGSHWEPAPSSSTCAAAEGDSALR